MKALVKGLSASLLLASISSVAVAGGYKDAIYKDTMPCPRLMGGWYVGAQVGYDMFKDEQSITTAVDTANPEISADGFAGGLFAGYGQYFNAFYLGGELFVNTSSADSNYNITTLTTSGALVSKFEARTSYGFNLLPGMRLNDTTTGFFKVGYNRVDVEHTGSIGGAAQVSDSGHLNGFSYGLGMETLLTGNWSVRTDYTHYSLGSKTNTLAAGTTVKNDVKDNQFMVGVVYHVA